MKLFYVPKMMNIECSFVVYVVNDKLCIEKYYKNHLKSEIHINNIQKNPFK